MNFCLLTGCQRLSSHRGLCRHHYKQLIKNSLITHGIKGGILEDSPTWKSWNNVRERCFKKRSKKFETYGAKGITMCQGWRSSCHKFFRDLGPRPPHKSIDRIDNDGGYWCGDCSECLANRWPMNCRWATCREQNLNQTRKNKCGYPGVKKKKNRYESYIGLGRNNKKYLGSFETPEEAGAAYMEAKNALKE